MPEDGDQITAWLRAYEAGDRSAFDRLVDAVYDDLKRIARRRLDRSKGDRTLDTTGLVNEAYMKLAEHTRAGWRDRKHFFRVAARAMRQIVIDNVRYRQAARRDERLAAPIDERRLAAEPRDDWLLRVDDALDRLAQIDPRLARVVECRFFAGYSEAETAEVLSVSDRTVRRDWVRARAWLKTDLGGTPPHA